LFALLNNSITSRIMCPCELLFPPINTSITSRYKSTN
jgi:hypothetical protein